jgi:hypothetical protein
MSSQKIVMACVALLGAAMLLASEARAGGMRTTQGAAGVKSRGCRDLVALKHPETKGAARKGEWDKCMADPDGYNK